MIWLRITDRISRRGWSLLKWDWEEPRRGGGGGGAKMEIPRSFFFDSCERHETSNERIPPFLFFLFEFSHFSLSFERGPSGFMCPGLCLCRPCPWTWVTFSGTDRYVVGVLFSLFFIHILFYVLATFFSSGHSPLRTLLFIIIRLLFGFSFRPAAAYLWRLPAAVRLCVCVCLGV